MWVRATGRLTTSPTRGKLITRRLVATVAGVEAIGALADREAARMGGEQAERVVVLEDRAGWIDLVARDSSPGSERRVHGWHLLKRTREAVQAATGRRRRRRRWGEGAVTAGGEGRGRRRWRWWPGGRGGQREPRLLGIATTSRHGWGTPRHGGLGVR